MKLRLTVTSILIFCIVSCGTQQKGINEDQDDRYAIIETVKYGEDGLYYKTLSYEELPFNYKFSYEQINQNNVRYNSITEEDRFINFDTIFNEKQRKEINNNLKNLKSVKLRRSEMSNPKVLSKKRSPYGTPMEKQIGYSSITFPFVVEGENGDRYGFMYRDSGLLYIYKKENDLWNEFARLEIHLVN
ncbi:hypothetical protein [Salinimicrobium sp. HB62]|uniref:hypothetical protein n=1 Tax=Salinimicrobium sp. HB62 TaxID=3077781 RepID=UPI002D790289|nr:hypothetical protein [Salinimicrobium sp. HB62]